MVFHHSPLAAAFADITQRHPSVVVEVLSRGDQGGVDVEVDLDILSRILSRRELREVDVEVDLEILSRILSHRLGGELVEQAVDP